MKKIYVRVKDNEVVESKSKLIKLVLFIVSSFSFLLMCLDIFLYNKERIDFLIWIKKFFQIVPSVVCVILIVYFLSFKTTQFILKKEKSKKYISLISLVITVGICFLVIVNVSIISLFI